MLNWKPEYIALLNRHYWMYVLKEASYEAYWEANAEIGRAARVRPLTVERWIEGTAKPNRVQGERLLRWAGRVKFWEWDEGRDDWRRSSIAEKLSELIRDSKKHANKGG